VQLKKLSIDAEGCARGKNGVCAPVTINAEVNSFSSMIRLSLFRKASHHHNNPVTNVGTFLKNATDCIIFF
jgi:hypothetical protein